MPWLSLIKAGLSLLDMLVGYLNNKQLLDAGEAKAISNSLTEANARVEKAQAARRAVKSDPGSLQNDKYRRD